MLVHTRYNGAFQHGVIAVIPSVGGTRYKGWSLSEAEVEASPLQPFQSSPLSSNSRLLPAVRMQKRMCSEVRFGVAHSRLSRKMSRILVAQRHNPTLRNQLGEASALVPEAAARSKDALAQNLVCEDPPSFIVGQWLHRTPFLPAVGLLDSGPFEGLDVVLRHLEDLAPRDLAVKSLCFGPGHAFAVLRLAWVIPVGVARIGLDGVLLRSS